MPKRIIDKYTDKDISRAMKYYYRHPEKIAALRRSNRRKKLEAKLSELEQQDKLMKENPELQDGES